jgi:hypothetical protein
LLHIKLLKDLARPSHWALAITIGAAGFLSNLAIALVGGLVIWWTARTIFALRADRNG